MNCPSCYMEHPYIQGFLFVSGLTTIPGQWIDWRGRRGIGPNRTLRVSFLWGWPNGKLIDSNQEHLMNWENRLYILLSSFLLTSEVKVLRLGVPGFRSVCSVLIPMLESDTKLSRH